MNNINEAHSIENEFKAKAYKASYTVDGRWVTVECDYGSQRAELHEGPPSTLAQILFEVILERADEDGRLASGPPRK